MCEIATLRASLLFYQKWCFHEFSYLVHDITYPAWSKQHDLLPKLIVDRLRKLCFHVVVVGVFRLKTEVRLRRSPAHTQSTKQSHHVQSSISGGTMSTSAAAMGYKTRRKIVMSSCWPTCARCSLIKNGRAIVSVPPQKCFETKKTSSPIRWCCVKTLIPV